MQAGKLIVITGPSGVGKGTLVKKLLLAHSELYLSISATTRSPRSHEEHGKDYYFLTKEEFQQMIKNNSLLEWAQYTENYYGTPRTPVEERLKQGQNVLLEIEVLGAGQIKANFPNSFTIFILPPSLEELERRLQDRGTETPEVIASRMEKAKEEIASSDTFDFKICNEDLEITVEDLEKIIFQS